MKKNAMKSTTGFKHHTEEDQGMCKVCEAKYTPDTMGNPKELKKSVDGLADYVKKNRFKGYT